MSVSNRKFEQGIPDNEGQQHRPFRVLPMWDEVLKHRRVCFIPFVLFFSSRFNIISHFKSGKRPLFIRIFCKLQHIEVSKSENDSDAREVSNIQDVDALFTTMLYLECVIDMHLCPVTVEMFDIPRQYNDAGFESPDLCSPENYYCNFNICLTVHH